MSRINVDRGGGILDVTEVLPKRFGVLVQDVLEVVGCSGVLDAVPVQSEVLQPVSSQQGGSVASDHKDVQISLLCLVENMHTDCALNYNALTSGRS